MNFANNNASNRITLRIFHHNHSGSENRARRADRAGHFLTETGSRTVVKTRRTRLRPWLAEIVDHASGSYAPNQGRARNRRGRFRCRAERRLGNGDPRTGFPKDRENCPGKSFFFPPYPGVSCIGIRQGGHSRESSENPELQSFRKGARSTVAQRSVTIGD